MNHRTRHGSGRLQLPFDDGDALVGGARAIVVLDHVVELPASSFCSAARAIRSSISPPLSVARATEPALELRRAARRRRS